MALLLVLQSELKAKITLYVEHILIRVLKYTCLCLLTKSMTQGCLGCESWDLVFYVF